MSKKEKQTRQYRGVRDEIRQQQLKTKDMSLEGKLKYFWGYYKFHVIIAAAVLIMTGTLIHDIATSKDYSFYAIMFNSDLLSEESMAASFAEYADLDTENYKCLIDTASKISMSAYSQYDMAVAQKMIALVQAGELDAVTMDSSLFYNYALSELFVDLRTVLTEEELSEYRDNLYYIDYTEVELANEESGYEDESTAIPDDPDAYDPEKILAKAQGHRHPENMENPVPIGIFMTDSPFAVGTGAYSQDIPVFGFVTSSEKTDTAKKYLEFLWDENVDFSKMLQTAQY